RGPMAFWSRRKSIDDLANRDAPDRLKPTLSAWHLVLLGVGAIVGTGIYTLIGVGADKAGPAVMLSFVIAGAVCACAALAYAELATMMPASGSAYTYSYASMGELIAWIVGWALILEYTVVCSAVAVGWSGYAVGFLHGIGVDLPAAISSGPSPEGLAHLFAKIGIHLPATAVTASGIINLPAIVIIIAVACLLLVGTRESANINSALVLVKIAALAAFVLIALPRFNPAHFTPFMPNGFLPVNERGVMAAAAIIFFAFYGFDAVSTAAEETKDPGKNLSIGIVGSMIICTVIYMAVAAAAIGAIKVGDFAKSSEPLSYILRTLGHPGAAGLIAGAAVVALPTVILAFMYGQSRIFFVMARDGLLPRRLGHVSKRGAPVAMTIVTAVVCSVIAGFLPLADIAALANAGTLAAFIATSIALMVLRRREPARARPFRTPIAWVVAPAAILGCGYLFYSLPGVTRLLFFCWMAIGLLVYFLFAARNSEMAKNPAPAAAE
ncbi:MAG TPA: amino acid permease, partial [Parvularculaceae bacterium]|nr:amino acid permease [Parvularculaceae bacterium]